MRLVDIFEAKKTWDLRHPERPDIPYFPKSEDPQYISPQNGFHFHYVEGVLILHSAENPSYSNLVVYGNDPEKAPTSSFWNQMSGLVNFADKTITISKEGVGSNHTLRQRPIANIRSFQQMLRSLGTYGVRSDYKLKGVPPHIAKTVGEVLKQEDPRNAHYQRDKPMVLYHGTSMKRWEEIQKTGLRPGKTPDRYSDLIQGYSENNVYLTTNAKTAMFYGKRMAKKDNSSEYVVLQVTVHDPARIRSDDRFARWGVKQFVTDKEAEFWDAPAERKAELVKRSASTKDALDPSFNALGELAYQGSILPKNIKLLKTYKARQTEEW